MTARLAVLAMAVAAVLCAGCAQRPSVRIGYLTGQPDSELMANLAAETLRVADARSVLVACDDLLACGRRLQAGDIDLLPGYSGSARAFLRTRDIAAGRLPAVRAALAPFGMTVTDGLGFRAPYRVLVEAETAARRELATIEDLAALDAPRVAAPPGYARQPGDGLFALARRYGLNIPSTAVAPVANPAERLSALTEGRADVAVVRAPYVPEAAPVRALRDSLAFYPAYEAMLVIGPVGDARTAFLRDALAPLTGAVSAAAMRRLIGEMALQGRAPDLLARQLLVEIGLIDATQPTLLRPEMTIAVSPADGLDPQLQRALLAVRRAFPDRPATPRASTRPTAALERGLAELAVLHVADFFHLGWQGQYRGRDPRAEAIAVLGRREFLLLTRGSVAPDTNPLQAGPIGIPPGWTSGGRVAARMLALAGRQADRRAPGPALIDALTAGRITAAIVLMDPSNRAALRALPPDGDGIRARSLARWLVSPPFFLNETRLAQPPVPGRDAPIDTYSMQVLLAGPAPQGGVGPVHGGPASAVATRNLPIPLRDAEALADAAGATELPDPVVPSFRGRGAEAARRARPTAAWTETVLVIAAVAFMAWAGYLLARPVRRGR
jgi:glycine betaine/choline ABC-type transport system substrate-binding protein